MQACPRCKQESISRFAKFRALVFSHPACPACGARLSLHGAVLFSFSACCLGALIVALVASAKLVQWLPEPLNLATGLGLGLALCMAPVALALRFAELKPIPEDEYRRLVVWGWIEFALMYLLPFVAAVILARFFFN